MKDKLQEAQRKMKAMEKRHKIERERMLQEMQYRLAEEKQVSDGAVGTAVM